MEKLKQELIKCLNLNVPFAFYRRPHSNCVKAIIQNNSSVNFVADFSSSGFIFAPFDAHEKAYMIPQGEAKSLSFPLKFEGNKPTSREIKGFDDTDKDIYIDLVQKAVDFINNSDTQKIVLSRKEKINIENTDTFRILEKLLIFYPNAFVYLWFHPLTGLWMGATPEILLEVNNNMFKTMALAGTQSYKGTLDINWDAKEKQEQQFVTDYIQLKLKDLNLTISEPFTIKAGTLLHICSDIKGELTSANELEALIKTLHPTPAVCGIPKENAKRFILENENYRREFYTGFLGEIASRSSVNLYVNLRCMRVDNESVDIYIGGGITKDSIPEKEWEETCIKSEVMKRVL